MIVAVTGCTGFIGSRLVARLQSEGHTVRALGRQRPGAPGVEFVSWDPMSELQPRALEGTDAVVHLAGEPVGQRWTSEVKRRIRDSRVSGTRNLVTAISRNVEKPRTLLAMSAIGFYGDRGDEILTEQSSAGNDFLSGVCVEWESEAAKAQELGLRVVRFRTGIVMGAEGGALKQMLGPFKAGVGGPAGSGKQWVSWIHVQDVVNLFHYALQNEAIRGPVNACAPEPVRNAEFAHALGHALGRPSMISTPAFALKLMFGEMSTAVLASQRVLPEAATQSGYRFQFSDIRACLNQILS